MADKRSGSRAEKRRQQGQYVRLTDMSRQRLLGYAESFRELSEKFRQESGWEPAASEPEGDGWISRDRQEILDQRRDRENRQVIGRNLEEVAAIMEQVASAELCYKPLEEKKEKMLIHALRAEGVFAEERKKPLPQMPGRVGIVTSKTGAAVRDIINIITRRWPMCSVILAPVMVQGDAAPAQIARAVRDMNGLQACDVMIVGRGGGSIEDLWAFNDERVVRAIYESEIPVISAVGHEPDVTISDFVADLRAATPSNGAELAVPDADEMRQYLDGLSIRSEQALDKKLADYRRRLGDLASRRVLQSPTGYIELKRMEAEMLKNRLLAVQERRIASLRRVYVGYAASLDALSPLKVLARGYAVPTNAAGRVLRSADEAAAAIEQGYFPFVNEEAKTALLSKNFDLYQIVAVRYTGGAPYREVAELVVNGGALEVVRVRYVHPLGHYADVHYDEYALCLVRKSDVSIPASDPFSLHLVEHLIDLPAPSSTDA